MNAQCSHLCLVENIYYSYIELSERRRGNILVGFPCVAKNRILVDVILSNAWENLYHIQASSGTCSSKQDTEVLNFGGTLGMDRQATPRRELIRKPLSSYATDVALTVVCALCLSCMRILRKQRRCAVCRHVLRHEAARRDGRTRHFGSYGQTRRRFKGMDGLIIFWEAHSDRHSDETTDKYG